MRHRQGLCQHPQQPWSVPRWGVGGRGNIRSQCGPLLCLAESMILLGSIERTQVGALLSNQLSPHRRLLTLRQKVLSEDGHRLSDSSIRFQVRDATILGNARSRCPPTAITLPPYTPTDQHRDLLRLPCPPRTPQAPEAGTEAGAQQPSRQPPR